LHPKGLLLGVFGRLLVFLPLGKGGGRRAVQVSRTRRNLGGEVVAMGKKKPKVGTREFWTIWAEFWGGSRYVVCDTHKTEEEARTRAKECESGGGRPHRIVEVVWR